MSAPPTGTVTFLFTDIEDSTNLARLHPTTWEARRQRHDAVLREAQLSNRRDVSVDGAPARSADLKWSTDKYDGFVGRIVMAQQSASQLFLMAGGGAPEKWPTIIPVMDAMLGSVRLNR